MVMAEVVVVFMPFMPVAVCSLQFQIESFAPPFMFHFGLVVVLRRTNNRVLAQLGAQTALKMLKFLN